MATTVRPITEGSSQNDRREESSPLCHRAPGKNERARKVPRVRRFWSYQTLLRAHGSSSVCDVSITNLAITPRARWAKLGVAIKMKLGATGVGNCSADDRPIKIGVTRE